MLSHHKRLPLYAIASALVISFTFFCYLYAPVPRTVLPPKAELFHLQTTPVEISQTSAVTPHPSLPTSKEALPSGNVYQTPDKVWHSAKFDNLTDNQRGWIGSWTKTNPYCRQELLTDRSAEAFVRARFHKTRPDIVEVYEALPIAILRADLFRYLVVLAEGGIWGDLDVTCEKDVAEWVPLEYRNSTIDMIVGLEFDMPWRGPGKPIASQFCNWVFVGQKSSRNLQAVVDAVVAKLKEIALANNVAIAGLTLEMLSDVVDVTGPKMMTIAILDSLSKFLGRPVDDRDFAGTKQPKLVGDVLIMPGNSFAANQNNHPTDQGDILVTHNYEGSWKKEDAEAKERKKLKQNPPPTTE